MGHYYYVVSAFPPLVLGVKPEMSYDEARQMLALNLSPYDWKQVISMQRETDLYNVRSLWLHEPINLRGNFGEKDLEEALLVKDNLPSYLVEFLDRYETTEERLRYFPSLLSSFYRKRFLEGGFLQKYHRLQRDIQLCLTALRASMSHRDLTRELQFEDPSDPLVALLLAQKDEIEAVLPDEYEDLKQAFLENKSEPKKLYRAILQVQLAHIEELETARPFSMDVVLGHLARLAIVEAWAMLDDEKGHTTLDQICRYE